MQSNGNTIFVGIKISEKLQDQLDSSSASVKRLFKENDSKSLQVITVEDCEYIGKLTKSGVRLEDVSNMVMNVKTMLRMICPKFSFSDDAIKILAITAIPERTYPLIETTNL